MSLLTVSVFLLAVLSSAAAPAPRVPASKPAASADRISKLELKLATLSQRITLLQNEITAVRLPAGCSDSSAIDHLESATSDLKRKTDDFSDQVDRLRRDVNSLDDVESHVNRLRNDVDDLN